MKELEKEKMEWYVKSSERLSFTINFEIEENV